MRTLAQFFYLAVGSLAIYVTDMPRAFSLPNDAEQLPSNVPSARSPQEVNVEAQKLVDGGNAAYKSKDYAKTVELYTELLRLKPRDPRAYYNRGNAYDRMNNFDAAAADFSEAIKIQPSFYLALMNRGNIFSRNGRYADAITDYDRALQYKTDDFLIFYNRGVAHERLGNDAQAVDDLTEAIRLNPNDAQSYADRGIVLSRLGKVAEARKDLAAALRISPDNARAVQGLDDIDQKRTDSTVDTPGVINEMSHVRTVDFLLELVEQACFKNGEDAADLEAFAKSRAWTPATEEERTKASASIDATLINSWISTTEFGSVAILQSEVVETSPVYVCSITTKLASPHVYKDVSLGLESRFKVAAVEVQDRGPTITTSYWLPHTPNCDAKTSLIASDGGLTLTIRLLHGRRRPNG